MRNFGKWKRILKQGMVLDNLSIKSKSLIDADSQFQVVGIRQIRKPHVSHETPVQVEKIIPTVIQTQLF